MIKTDQSGALNRDVTSAVVYFSKVSCCAVVLYHIHLMLGGNYKATKNPSLAAAYFLDKPSYCVMGEDIICVYFYFISTRICLTSLLVQCFYSFCL